MRLFRWFLVGCFALCVGGSLMVGCARTLPTAPPTLRDAPISLSKVTPGQPRWFYQASAQIVSTPAAGLHDVYITSLDHKLIAVNMATGKPSWSFKTDDLVRSSPVLSPDGQQIYVGSNDGRLYSLNERGEKLWTFPTMGPIDAAPTLDVKGNIYVASHDGRLYALPPRPAKGQKRPTPLWIYQAAESFRLASAVFSPSGNTLYIGSYDGTLHAIPVQQTSSQARARWRRKVCQKLTATAVVGANGMIYVGCWGRSPSTTANDIQKGELKAIDSMGNVRWSFHTQGPILAPPQIGSDGVIYVGSDDSWFYAIGSNGKKKWAFRSGVYHNSKGKTRRVEGSEAFIQGGAAIDPVKKRIYFGSTNEYLYALSREGGLLWHVDLHGWVDHTPLLVGKGESLYVAAGSRLFAVNP